MKEVYKKVMMTILMILITNISYAQFTKTINSLGKNYREIFGEQFYIDNDTLIKEFEDIVVKYAVINDTIVNTIMHIDFKEGNILYINILLRHYLNNSNSIYYDIIIPDTFDYNNLIFKKGVSKMYIVTDLHSIEFVVVRKSINCHKITLSYELRRCEE